MRLREFATDAGGESGTVSTLAGILNFLRSRAHDYKIPLEIGTSNLIAMVQKTGLPFSYSALVDANKNPMIKNLIHSINKDKIEIKPYGDEGDEGNQTIVNKPKGQEAPAPAGKPGAFPAPGEEEENLQDLTGGGAMGAEQPQEPMQPRVPAQKVNTVGTMAKRALGRRK